MRWVDVVNRVVGRAMMYLIFVMIGILLLSSISRGFFDVSYIWSVEMAQFMLTAYYILGGGYSMHRRPRQDGCFLQPLVARKLSPTP